MSRLGRAEVLLRRVEMRLAHRLPGHLAGTHSGLGIGPGWLAESARPYEAGTDDVRFMDWPVTARLGEPYVREHQAERELETTVIVDTTASMAFGTVEQPKRELAAAVVAAIGVLTDRPGNRLGALIHGGVTAATSTGPERAFVRWPPRSGRHARLLLLRRLLQSAPAPTSRTPAFRTDTPGTPATMAQACRAAAAQLRRPGLVVVVGDFLDPNVEALIQALRPLTVRHHVIAIEVHDPLEFDLRDVGTVGVVDPETGQSLLLDTGDPHVRAAYREVAAEHAAAVADALRSARVAHIRVTTGGDWVAELARYILRAQRTAGRPAGRPTLRSAS